MRFLIPVLLLLCLGATPSRAEDAALPRRVGLMTIRKDGAYRIAPEQWRAWGIRHPRRLEIRRGGKAVPTHVGGEVGLPEGTVAFAAKDTATPHHRHATYELWHVATAPPSLEGSAVPKLALPREITTDRFLGALGAADAAIYAKPTPHWFLALAPRGRSATVQVGPLGATPGADQTLEVEIYGAWTDLAVVEATWGGRSLGRAASPDPSTQHGLSWRVPGAWVPTSPAPLILTNVSPQPSPPPRNDVSDDRGMLCIDTVRLVGPGARLVSWRQAQKVEVVAPPAPSDPLTAVGAARHVILATPPLLAGARRLAAHRRTQGMPSAAVRIEDVYDRYGFAEHRPAAIHAFVRALRARRGASLDYLLLAGDATYDRTDIVNAVTIPTAMARTMYNGATSADVLYGGSAPGRPAVGRLPFVKAATMQAYVDRVVRYETKPPQEDSRRLLRFITSPGRFGAFIDGIIEGRFRRVLATNVPLAYDVTITYASPTSAYLWPPAEFNQHVVQSINDGALYTIYVGHGFAQGFDTLRVGRQHFPILHVRDAPAVRVTGTPPVVFVLACTTAMFDGSGGPGIGEALLRQPGGPVAYWGATRVCHPGFNALMGESIAGTLSGSSQAGTSQAARPRLGRVLAQAAAETRDTTNRKFVRGAIKVFSGGVSSATLADEGSLMYTLLGDPALRLAVPRQSLGVSARVEEPAAGALDAMREVAIEVRGAFPQGAHLTLALEWPRSRRAMLRHKGLNPSDPASYPKIRENHAAANNLVLARRAIVAAAAGHANGRLRVPAGIASAGLVVKAHGQYAGDVHVGAVRLR